MLPLAACNIQPEQKAEINKETKFSTKEYEVKASPRVTEKREVAKGGGRYHVGKPYKIKGKWYKPKENPEYVATGKASWYGPNFHGRLTANGEIYDQYSLSAAHPTMPLPSYARVTNIENGRSVIVRVNDRGPFSGNRIIDMSAKAADLLDYKKQGIANVKVEYVGKARMDGHDGKFLLASYRDPNSGPFQSPDTGTSGTMVAMAADLDVIETGATIQTQIEAILVAGAVPVPMPRPGRIEPGISLDVILDGNTRFARSQTPARTPSLVSSFMTDADGNAQASAFAGFEDAARDVPVLSTENPATQAATLIVGTFTTGVEAEPAYDFASVIGPTKFVMAPSPTGPVFEVLLEVGGDVADPIIDYLHRNGHGQARLAD